LSLWKRETKKKVGEHFKNPSETKVLVTSSLHSLDGLGGLFLMPEQAGLKGS